MFQSKAMSESTKKSARPKRYNKKLKLTSPEHVGPDTQVEEALIVSDDVFKEDLEPLEHESDKNLESIIKSSKDTYSCKVDIETLLNDILLNHDNDNNDFIEDCDEDYYDCFDNEEEIEQETTNSPNGDHNEQDDFSTKVTDNEPIYYGHSMPIRVSMLLILVFCVTHSVSGSQLEDLLTLIGVHCMESHPGLKSLFHYKTYFANLHSPLKKHFYCTYCLTCVDEDMEICPNKKCLKDITEKNMKSYFIEVPIEDQLKSFFKRESFVTAIKGRFHKHKENSSNIEDICDGKLYKNLSKSGGPLSHPHWYNLSFTLNTDGIPIFKSSKYSIWPVYLMVNELPFKMRKKSENMLFCGLWYSDTKPFMSTFSKPLHKSLKNLESQGIHMQVDDNEVICKCHLLCITADLPAKSLLMNMNQFNGAYCCCYCLEKGETFRTKKGGSVHIFPFNSDSPYGKSREHHNSINDAKEAVRTQSTINGIKGPSFLMCLESFDFVKGVTIDYMHGALLGITKLLINLWFSGTYSKEDFSLACNGGIIDKRLLNIKPPAYISRVPRTITNHFKYWKASELRSWLFFYSLPTLHDIMPETYFLHYCAFVQGLFLLCQSSISPLDLQQSERLLIYFVMTFKDLYGERYQTLNLHSLLHLTECVRNNGPLWSYSCFTFENENGNLTKYFHGTQHIDTQILSSVNIVQMLPSLIKDVPEEFRHVLQKLYTQRFPKAVEFHVQFLGKSFEKALSTKEEDDLFSILSQERPNMRFYSRMLFRGEMYHSRDYGRVTKRNTYTVKYFCPIRKVMSCGQIRFFGAHDGIQKKNFAFIKCLSLLSANGSLLKLKDMQGNRLGIDVSHIHVCEQTECSQIVEIENLMCVCVDIILPNSNRHFVAEAPNKCETD